VVQRTSPHPFVDIPLDIPEYAAICLRMSHGVIAT
jgi:hypothetical protein